MNFLGRLFGRLFRAESGSVSDLTNPRKWLLDWAGYRRTQAGVEVNHGSSMGLSTYYACVRCIAEDVSKLPLITYRRMDRGKERVRDHPAYRVLHDQANEDMSAMEFRQLLQYWASSWGNGYAEISPNARGGAALYPIHPDRVQIKRKPGTNTRTYYVHNNDGSWGEIPAARMLHIRGIGDEEGGYSVCKTAAESLGLSIAAQTFGASFFGNGSTLSGVLTHPNTIGEEALKSLRAQWTETYGGPYNSSKPAILEEGMKFERIGIPPEEAQFLETRQFQVEEVCRWFRMPPHKIQHLLRATFSNIEHQSIEYVTDTLQPWLTRWEQEIKRKLFVGEEDIFAEHLTLGLLRGDNAGRVAFYNGMFMIGALSQNDIREAENMNGIGDEGDTYYVPLNMVRSEDAAKGLPQNQVTPTGNEDPEMPELPEESSPDEEEDPEDGNPAPGTDTEQVSGSVYSETFSNCQDCESQVPGPDREAVIAAMRPVLEAAATTVLRKEERAACRAAEKFAGDVPGFSAWLDEFYKDHADYVNESLYPAGIALYRLLQECVPHTEPLMIGAEHVEASKKELCRLFVLGQIAQEFPKYAAERAKALAASVISEVTRGS